MAEEKGTDQAVDAGRRAFLAKAGAMTVAVAAVAAVGIIPGRAEVSPALSADEGERMRQDLSRALAKPVADRKWLMAIDTRKCIGCHACTVACMAENNLPPDVMYRQVPEVESGSYPVLQRFFMPTNCFQCAKPPCVPAANAKVAGAMSIRPDGVVAIDYDKMKGRPVFDAAKHACPYASALALDKGGNHTDGTPAVQAYERRQVEEYGRTRPRGGTNGVTRKCHFCLQRIERGVLPACVTTCTGRAMYFGDGSDPASLVAELTAQPERGFRFGAASGTEPRVVYLHESADSARSACMNCHGGGE